jgi:hypothetical protein
MNEDIFDFGFAICDLERMSGSQNGSVRPYLPRRMRRSDETPLQSCANRKSQIAILKSKAFLLFAVALLFSRLAHAAEYNLGELAKAKRLELFNRSIDQSKTDSPEAIFLTAASDDGLAWIKEAGLSEGTIEIEIKGKNVQGQSFVGIAFHGQDNRVFDAVYMRPFNFQSAEQERQSHSIQYISIPDYDWKKLRDAHPGKYEFAITPPPDPNSWVKLKLVITSKNVTAFVNGSDKPSLNVELLNNRLKGKVGLWVGNGSDGWFRNLKIISTSK